MLLAVVWRVVVAVPLVYVFLCSIFYFLASAASFSTCDMCLRFSDCPVVLDIELSVSARHQKTRVLLCARRLLLLHAAAASGGVRHKFQNCMRRERSKITSLGQSEHQKKRFLAPTTAKLSLPSPPAALPGGVCRPRSEAPLVCTRYVRIRDCSFRPCDVL